MIKFLHSLRVWVYLCQKCESTQKRMYLSVVWACSFVTLNEFRNWLIFVNCFENEFSNNVFFLFVFGIEDSEVSYTVVNNGSSSHHRWFGPSKNSFFSPGAFGLCHTCCWVQVKRKWSKRICMRPLFFVGKNLKLETSTPVFGRTVQMSTSCRWC